MRRLLGWLVVFALMLAPASAALAGPLPGPAAQEDVAQSILDAMTPAEKVGQLFVVSFYGTSVDEDSDVFRLITEQHVGGVVLLAANDNITDTANAAAQVLAIANGLQGAAVAAAQMPRANGEDQLPEQALPPFIPLFVAVNHEGDGYPFTEIRSGMTGLPNAMAIGATWDPDQAEVMGRIAGSELAVLGVNLLLGPSLDVLETPRPQGEDLGTRVFGGDPFWVGLMGQAYIRGVHLGSGGQVGVVAKHFPGHGGSDRRPEEEVPTVRKSFEELQNFDLLPFFAVTGRAPNMAGTADAVLAAHIHFQGFQGNIRQNTEPVSFDRQAFSQLLALPDIDSWRQNGGVTMSDSLGLEALKRFFTPFNNRVIARDAFDTGNDLLLLTDFGENARQDQYDNIVDTLAFFTQRYQVDPDFAQKVDAAVARILQLKLRLYRGRFDPATVQRPDDGLRLLGQERARVVGLGRSAATLISPAPEELLARAPQRPAASDRIVFFTDVRQGRQCQACPPFPLLDRRQLEEAVLRLYGPGGSGEIRGGNLQSYTFEDLVAYLNAPPVAPVGNETPTPEPPAVGLALAQADWIVFSMLDITPTEPASSVISTFLAQRPDLVGSKKIVVFAHSEPYFLDTTDLSKVTAFYALYSRAPAFVDVAALLLFREWIPQGAPPVSVPSIGYDLIEITKPDPNRVIELYWEAAQFEGEGTAQPSDLKLGDTITLTTGIIRDHNRHRVPDDTPVRFKVFYREEGLPEFFEAQTQNGIATIPLVLNRIGHMEITAESEPARSSFTLPIDVEQSAVTVSTAIVPTPLPTLTPAPTATEVPPTPTESPSPTATPAAADTSTSGRVDWRAFFIMCLGLFAVAASGYRIGMSGGLQRRLGLRLALSGIVGTLLGYNLYALGLPGSNIVAGALGAMAAPGLALLGGLLGLAVGWYWFNHRAR